MSQTMQSEFDIDRAYLKEKDIFKPFLVEVTASLQNARERGTVENDTPILWIERGNKVLAFITKQMAYHHVAQGELAGEPYLVSF